MCVCVCACVCVGACFSRSCLLGLAFAAQLPLSACLQPLHVAWSILVDADRVLRSGGANSPRFTEGYGEGGRATVHSLPALSSHRMTCSGLSSAGDVRGGPVPFWLRRCWRNPRSDTSSNAQIGQPLGRLTTHAAATLGCPPNTTRRVATGFDNLTAYATLSLSFDPH